MSFPMVAASEDAAGRRPLVTGYIRVPTYLITYLHNTGTDSTS